MSFVKKAVSSVVSGVVNAVKSVVKAVVDVVSSVVKFVTQPFMGMLGATGDIPDANSEANRQQGVLLSAPAGGDFSVPVIYGMRQVGGQMIYFETGSDNNKYLWVCYVLSEGPIEGLYDISVDDEILTTPTLISSLNAGAVANVDKTGSRYTGKTVFQFWNGSMYPQSQITSIATYTANHLMRQAPSWKQTNVLNGAACLMARYEWKKITTQEEADNNPFNGNIPQVKVTLLGKKVASLMTNQSSIEWGDFPNGYVERYSTNPAECLLDYLRNPYYGKGLKNSEIDWDSFQKAANKFNQQVTYIDGVKGPILTCNHVLDTNATLMSNVKVMLQGMRSYMPYVKGKYKLKVEDAGNATDILSGVATIVATFNKDNIVGNINYSGVDRSSKYTAVEVTYVSPMDKWSTQTMTFPTEASDRYAYEAVDGYRENKGSFTFPTLTNYAMAYDMARLIFNKSRLQQSCSFTTTLQAMELEPGDNIYINGELLDFVDESSELNVPWRIVSLKLNDNYTYTVDCVRNPDFIYPHARANEKDSVLPTYIPRGNYIYYPGVFTDIGLTPPGAGFWLPGQQPGGGTSGFPNPSPTDPSQPGGGGVGGGTNDTTPPDVPPPPPLNDYIQIDNVTYVSGSSPSTITAIIEFNQPPHPLYAGVDFWFKRNISTDTAYRQWSDQTIAGTNNKISVRLQDLIKGSIPYILICRVKYHGGDSSTVITRIALNVSGAISSENPVDYEEVVGAGWTPPSINSIVRYDVPFASISAIPTYSSPGVPTTMRGLTYTVKQDINLRGYNDSVVGVTVYYKQASATYWGTWYHQFPDGYIPGASYSFTQDAGLGVRTYPNSDNATDNYNFIFRFKLRDGSESTLQSRTISTVDIENLTAADVFYGAIYAVSGQEDTKQFDVITIQQAPPGAVSDSRDLVINYFSAVTQTNGSTQGVRFFITPPVTSDMENWAGVRLYKKEVLSTSTSTTTEDFTPITISGGYYSFFTAITYDSMYEYVLVPLVSNSGSIVEANNAWYFAGVMHNRQADADYPSDANWYQYLTKSYAATATSLAKIGTAQPAGILRDTQFATVSGSARIVGQTLLTGGYPREEREMQISIKQLIPPNNNSVVGVKIYYKPSSFNYYYYTTHNFTTPYTIGSTQTFTIPVKLGVRSYPSVPTGNNNYDFVIRWRYSDGLESTYQLRATVPVEKDALGNYSFDPFASQTVLHEKTDVFTLVTVDDAPPGTVTDPRDITIGLNAVVARSSPSRLVVTIEPPVLSSRPDWYGVRVRYRKVPIEGGTAAAFEQLDYFPVPQPNTGIWQFTVPVDALSTYQVVLTPVVRYNSVKTEARTSWIGKGLINPNDVDGGEYYLTKMNFKTIETATVGAIQASPFPTGAPRAVIKLWKKILTQGTSFASIPAFTYFELEYNVSHVVGFTGVRIYRRANQGSQNSSYAKYYGTGRWEYLDVVPGTNATTLANGNVLVNLRAPISYQEFNAYYEKVSGVTLLNTSAPWSTKKILASPSATSTTIGYDYLIVVSTTEGASTVGMLLPPMYGTSTTTTSLPQEVELSTFDNYDAGYKRDLTEGTDGSRVSVADSSLMVSAATPYAKPTNQRGSDVV